MLEILKFAVEGPLNFIIVLILSLFWGIILMTLFDKFKPISINYFSPKPTISERQENIKENE